MAPPPRRATRLHRYAPHGVPVVLVVVVRRVHARSVEVQVVTVPRAVGRTGPVITVAADVVGATGVVVAAEEETNATWQADRRMLVVGGICCRASFTEPQ